MIARIRQTTGQYREAIYIIAIVMVVSLILPILARKRPRRDATERLPEQRAA